MEEPLNFWKLNRLAGIIFAGILHGSTLNGRTAEAPHWVGTWGCGIQLTEPRNLPPPPGLTSNTLRQIVRVSIGGKQLRAHFSNVFGTNDVVMNSVHLALNPSVTTSSLIDPATDTVLKFGGIEAAIIPAGRDIWSDPIAFNLPASTNLAITIGYGKTSGNLTGHPGARCASYLLPGNAAASTDLTGAIKTEHWYNIENVDVLADRRSATLVTFGDSITDGRGSTTGANNRWPDELATRLQTNAATAGVGVVNVGIGGNGLFGGLGPAAVRRFGRDVLDQSGVRWVIIFEGVNDIGSPGSTLATATNMITAYQNLAAQARAKNLRVYGATITPFGGSSYYSDLHEAERQRVNAWIRTNNAFDAVIDFDAAVRDPVTFTNLQKSYDSDHLHLNPAGYRAMAEAISLSLFTD